MAPAEALPTLESLRGALAALRTVVPPTPLLPLTALGSCLPHPVWAKAELLQPMGAFKIRGAWTALSRLDDATRARGVVTSSSGNHGQGLAFAAARFGVRCVVVMPESTPRVKVEGVRRYGGEVVFAGAVRSLEQAATAERLAREEQLTLVPPFDHPSVILGQATCALEILEERPEITTLISPVSGGGLLAGSCATVLALGRHDLEVVPVEPAGAAKLSAALAAGHPVTLPETRSMADGLLTRSVGALTWPIIRQVVHRAVTVSEEEIAAAVRWLHAEAGLRVEPSGATAFAALLAGRITPAGPAAVILSGGNVDDELFQRLVA